MINKNLVPIGDDAYKDIDFKVLDSWAKVLSDEGAKLWVKEKIIISELVYVPQISFDKMVSIMNLRDQVAIMKLMEHLKRNNNILKISEEIKLKENLSEKREFLTKLPRLGFNAVDFIMDFQHFLQVENVPQDQWFQLLVKCSKKDG